MPAAHRRSLTLTGIPMKLFHSLPSPFVRKCRVVAHELGLTERIELVSAAAHPINRDRNVVAHNPSGKIPTLITDEGMVLYDSRVICEYLNAMGNGKLVPQSGPARWSVLTELALADAIMEAAVLVRYETVLRPEPLRWNDWSAGQMEKVTSGLGEIERRASSYADRVDLGTIGVGCALGYLDFRFASLVWRENRPNAASWFERFNERPSMVATRPEQ
jgi:glutathione S-transferase